MRNSVSTVKYKKFVDEAVFQLLSAGAIQLVRQCPKVVSPLGVVTKINSDKLRLIVNMRYVNKALVIPKFKMETLSSLEDLSKPFDFMVSFDLKLGFWHIPLAADAQPWVGFQWPDEQANLRYFQFRRLPFGLAIAPWAFTKIMRQLVSRWRGMNIRVLPYLDDFLFMASTSSEASALAEFIQTEFRTLGLDVNYEKSVVNPTQRIEQLGMMVDTVRGVFEVPARRWDNLQVSIRILLSTKRHRVPVRQLASCVGKIISMKIALGPVVQLYTRYLYQVVESAPSWFSFVPVSPLAIEELEFWQDFNINAFFQPIWPPSNPICVQIASDASATAWGGLILSSSYRPLPSVTSAHEFFNSWERSQSSTLRELLGVLGTIQAFLPWCRDAVVFCQTDCQNVIPVSRKGSSKESLNAVAKRLFWFCIQHNVVLRLNWAPKDSNQ